MKGLVYGGPGARSWTEIPDPVITAPQDAIIRVDAVTICGTDLHILGGDVPEVASGRVLGHEAVGTVVETGSAVSGLTAGDRVLASCISACGIRNVTITTGLVDTFSTPRLLAMLVAGQLDLGHMVTHRFGFDEFSHAYDVFADAAHSGALKVLVSR